MLYFTFLLNIWGTNDESVYDKAERIGTSTFKDKG